MRTKTIYRINHNWTPDTNYHPEWIEMTKSQYMEEYGIEEGDWQEMVNAGAIITQRQLRERIIDLVGQYHPSVGTFVPIEIFNDIRKGYLDQIKAAERERNEAIALIVEAAEALKESEAALELAIQMSQRLGSDYTQSTPRVTLETVQTTLKKLRFYIQGH